MTDQVTGKNPPVASIPTRTYSSAAQEIFDDVVAAVKDEIESTAQFTAPSSQTPYSLSEMQNGHFNIYKTNVEIWSENAPNVTPSLFENMRLLIAKTAKEIDNANTSPPQQSPTLFGKAWYSLINDFIMIDRHTSTTSKIRLFDTLHVEFSRFAIFCPSSHTLVAREACAICVSKIGRLKALVYPRSHEDNYTHISDLIAEANDQINNTNTKEAATPLIIRGYEILRDIYLFVKSTECSLSAEQKDKLIDKLQAAFTRLKNAEKDYDSLKPEPPQQTITLKPNNPEIPRTRTVYRFAILALLASLVFMGVRHIYFRLTRSP